MKKLHLLLCLCFSAAAFAQDATTLWQIGQKDKSAADFALGPYDYSKFGQRFDNATAIYEIGLNKPADFPFVIPGPDDDWAGNRSAQAVIIFGIKDLSAPVKGSLVIDFVETHSYSPPVLSLNINGFVKEIKVPQGNDQHYFSNRIVNNKPLNITVEIPENIFKKGDNVIVIKSISGSWAVFDRIALMTDTKPALTKPVGGITIIGSRATPALVYGNSGELRQPVALTVLNTGAKKQVAIMIDGKNAGNTLIKKGINTIETTIPEVDAPKNITVSLAAGAKQTYQTVVQAFPVKKMTVYLVQHTHTDIGYTKPQTEILREHIRYIDYAVEYCELTENEPDDARFRWTCEAAWAVREYIRNRPQEQINKFLKYIRNGQIEVTGMFFNMAEIVDENSFKTFLEPIREFKRLGIPVTTAMQNDVNGIAWCLADYMPDLGIKYFSMGENGHRALIPFDRPTVYKWESPSGKQVFSYRSDHYHTGNFWGISNNNASADLIAPRLFDYLAGLDKKGYPFDAVSVQYSGYRTDNSPPSMHESKVIREWNEKYAYPRLRSAVFHEFMDYITAKYADRLPVYRAAYPDWWTDGFGSAARETGASRQTHSDMIAIQGLLSMAVAKGQKLPSHTFNSIRHIHENLLFYDEHTYGAAESISDPLCENSQIQWAEKGSYAWEALKNAQIMYETSAGLLQEFIPRQNTPVVTFYNTLNHPRSGVVELYIDHEIIPQNKAFKIVDENGNELKTQHLRSRSEGAYYAIYAENIPPMGYMTYSIIASQDAPTSLPDTPLKDYAIENDYFKISFDPLTGGIKSLYDKELNTELVDPKATWQLGGFVYETLKGNRRQMEQYKLTDYERNGLSDVKITAGKDGAVYQTVIVQGKSDCCEPSFGIRTEIRLFRHEKRIELYCELKKSPLTAPDGIYVAFPFKIDNAKLYFDVQGGVVSAGENQLEATANDWNTVQTFVSARNDRMQFVVGSNTVPLFQLGDINTGRYKRRATYDKQHVYSWVTNNYWTTNFRASQEGELCWTYYLTSTDDISNAFADRFGRDSRVPLFARVIPKGKPNNMPASWSAFRFSNPQLIMTSVTPSIQDGYLLLNVREPDGKPATLQILDAAGKPLAFSIVNALEEPLSNNNITENELKPFENKFIKLRVPAIER
ncbi:MAG: hypothetical protein LBD53_11745 [Tannerella sp.]|jgi:hypothetical protein|nr:hypothetical protein [Tannerella sp.]